MNRSQFRSRDPTVPQHGTKNPDQNTNKVNYRRNQVMKKLLTILVMALALCLVCGAALALDEDYPRPADYIADGTNTITIGADTYVITSPDATEMAEILAQYHTKDAATITIKVGYTDKNGADLYKDIRVNPHTYPATAPVTLVKAATCFTKGSYKVKCSCGYETTATLDKGEYIDGLTKGDIKSFLAAHQPTWVSKVKEEATCSEEGVNGRWCPTCKVFDPDYMGPSIPKTVHIFNKMIETKEWNCQQKGQYYKVCINCGIFEGQEVGKTEKTYYNVNNIAEYQALLYDPDSVMIHPENAWNGYNGHNWSDWNADKPATCYVGKTYVRKCLNAGCTATESFDGAFYSDGSIRNNWPLSPVWEPAADEPIQCTRGIGTNVWFVCKNCGGAAPGHKLKGEVKADGRLYDPYDNFYMVLPHWYEISNTYLVTKAKAAAYGWAARNDKGLVPATCTEGAYYEYFCVRGVAVGKEDKHTTHKVYVEDKPALGHNWAEWRPVGGLEGKPLYYERECSRCHKTERQDYPTELCPAHDYKVTTEPTCTEAGVKTCSVCGDTQAVPALGHDWKTIVETPATCSKEGKGTKLCNRCDAVEKDVVIEKIAHTWDEGKITKEATKEADGEKTFTCTVCGETKTDAVKWEPAKDPKYTMTASYNGTAVTGKLVHDDSTVEAAAKFVRVTFYVEGNYYMATMAEVEADGTFSVDGVGPIVYITAVATGNSSVNPEDVQTIAPAVEIFVK